MVRLGRILRDYQDAGSVNGLLALWGFVDDTTFLTKAGHVGVVYRVRGVDYEGLSHPQRQALAHRFEAGASSSRRALPRLSVPAEADRRRRSSPAPATSRSRTRRSSAARRT